MNPQKQKTFLSQLTDGLNWSSSKNFFQNYYAIKNHRSISLATDVFERLNNLKSDVRKARKKKKSVTYALAKNVFGIANLFVENVLNIEQDFFDINGWVTPFSDDFASIIYNAYKTYPRVVFDNKNKSSSDSEESSQKSNKIIFVNISENNHENIEIGWQDFVSGHIAPKRIFCKEDMLEKVKTLIAEKLWQQYKDDAVIVFKKVKHKNLRGSYDYDDQDSTTFTIEADSIRHALQSTRADQLVANYKRAFAVNISRTVMLEGPPGTGKSTLAQSIIRQLDLRAVRICIEDINSYSIPTIMELIRIFKPNAIIIDDFDRCDLDTQKLLLELQEWFLQNAKLTIVTVNDKMSLDQALMRPGRFDEIITIKELDDVSIRNILGVYYDEVGDQFKKWPVAYINEYMKRRQYMSVTEAKSSITELQKRVDKLLTAYDDLEDATPFIGGRSSKLKMKKL